MEEREKVVEGEVEEKMNVKEKEKIRRCREDTILSTSFGGKLVGG